MRRIIIASIISAVIVAACGGGSSHHYKVNERVPVKDGPDIVVERLSRVADDRYSTQDSHYLQAEAGKEYVEVYVRVVNDTDIPAGVDAFFDFKLLSRGTDIEGEQQSIGERNGGLRNAPIPPGTDHTGRLIWKVADGFDRFSLQYAPGQGALLGQVVKGEKNLTNLKRSGATYIVDLGD